MSESKTNSTSLTPIIYTIGHSNHSMEQFIQLLKSHSITAIADVRSKPYSQYNPQFNKENLEDQLKKQQIKYVFFGNELGARPQNQSYYHNGQVVFERVAQGKAFEDALNRLTKGSEKYQIALMCAEKRPLDCHRTILICRYLKNKMPNIKHILADGICQDHSQTEQQLIAETKTKPELFDEQNNENFILNKAYQRRQQDIAYQTE